MPALFLEPRKVRKTDPGRCLKVLGKKGPVLSFKMVAFKRKHLDFSNCYL